MNSRQISDTIDIENSELYLSDIKALINDEKKFEQYYDKHKENLYTLILLTLTHISFEEARAKELFGEILKHKKTLDSLLQRDVGISVATLDYLQNIKKFLHDVSIMDEGMSDFLTDSTTKDELTGLYVRDILDVFLKKEIENAKRKKTHLSFVMLDIDDFKPINDTYGHQKGDEALKAIGKLINENSRKMDFAARYGGEEISIVMPNTKSDKAFKLADRIRQKIESLSFKEFSLTVSIGIAQTTSDTKNETDLISLADEALYKAKENGKNQIVVHS